jgi:hypothetical protein
MKAKLEFDLPEERLEFNDAVNGSLHKSVLCYMSEYLRDKVKYGSEDVDASSAYEHAYEHILYLLDDNKIDIYN